jgi:hypothetical protein
MKPLKFVAVLFTFCCIAICTFAQETERWDKTASATEHPNIGWFKDAKFGMFIKQTVAIVSIGKAGNYSLSVKPIKSCLS